ncbi:MAG: gliding motility-associated C-terminal domain-containing protein [Lewinella sp.]|uniref:T9SS type B sorting domain-containing protein n=1 Tax=Lewinella sp. TaxID=2004506 RepID=UPI003D6BB39B
MIRTCLSALFTLLLFSNITQAQPLWSCDGSMIIAVGGDFYINRTQVGDNTINFEALPIPNVGLINAIGYRRSDNCIYGIDQNIPGVQRIFKLSPDGEYNIVREIDGALQPHAGTVSFDDNYLVVPSVSDSMNILYFIDIRENTAPQSYSISVPNGGTYATYGGTDFALDIYTNQLHGYHPAERVFSTISPESGLVTNRESVSLIYGDNYRPGVAFLNNQVLVSFAGEGDNSLLSFYHLNSGTLVDEVVDVVNYPNLNFTDACSCIDFDIAIQQSLPGDTLRHCQRITSTIRVVNRSSSPLPGNNFTLRDSFPAGVIIEEVLYNPYPGEVSGIGTNILQINNFDPDFGIDSIVLSLIVTEAAALGNHEVQAVMNGFTNLPEYPGGRLLSNNPRNYQDGELPTPFTILGSDSLSTVVTEYYLCEEDTLWLNPVAGQPGFTLTWADGGNEVPRLITQSGYYEAMISDACITRTFSLLVEDVYLDVDIGADQTILFGQEAEFIAAIDNDFPVIDYSWIVNDSLLLNCAEDCDIYSFLPEENSSLVLAVIDQNDCVASDEARVRLEFPFFAPNVFSPDNDGRNDQFYIQSSGDIAFKNFRIFDRWGGLLFEQKEGFTNDISLGWDGTSQFKDAAQGTYIWDITLVLGRNGEEQHFSGGVTLLR